MALKVLDISKLTTNQLTALHNQLPGVKPVKFWSTRKHALDRVQACMTKAGMMAVNNGDGGAALVLVTQQAEKPAKAPAAKRAARNADTRRANSAAAGDATHEDSQIISVVVGENPKRAGTAAHARFALYRTGMTVEQFVAAVFRAGGNSRKARSNLRWDEAHGFVRVK